MTCIHCGTMFVHYHRVPIEGVLHCDDCRRVIDCGAAWRRAQDQRPLCDSCYYEYGEAEEAKQYVLTVYEAKDNAARGIEWD